jgi:hypothetical protein
MARTTSAKKKLPLPSLGGSVAHKPLWLPASSSICSLLALSSESLESLYGAPALKCYILKKIFMNTASKLGPHTQTDRGTCPGVGL